MSTAAAPRRPKGYLGINHVTRGGDILAVLQTVHTPVQTLGAELTAKLAGIKFEGMYPIELLLEMLERLDAKLGTFHLKQVGWTIFQKHNAATVKANVPSARALLATFDAMYHQGNKGVGIGGWKLLRFDSSGAELEKTSPHHCLMEEGIVEEALRTIGASAVVRQSECFRKGASACRFVITPKVLNERWTG